MASKRVLIILLPALAALLTVTAACSSKSNDGSTSGNSNTGNSNNGGALPGCPTAATMKSELGLDVVAGQVQDRTNVKVCHYTPAAGAKGNAIVRFQAKSSAAQFAAEREIFKKSGQPYTEESGVGDESYSSVLSAVGI